MKVILTVLLATFLAANNPNASIPRTTTNLRLAPTIYSGNCTLYKLTLVKPSQKKYTPIKTAFAKVVVDKSSKRFTLFFDGRQVGSWSGFNSYADNQQGGEGFTMNSEWSAYRLTAERTLSVYNTMKAYGGNDLGYEYEITNYKVN